MYSFLKLLNELSSDFNTPIVESMISIQYDKISLNIPYGGVKRISKGLIFFITRPPIIGGGPIVTVLPCPVIPMIRRTSGISWFISLLIPGRFSSLSSKSRSCRNSCALSNASAVSFYSSILSILHIECMSSLTIKILLFV